MERIFDLLLNNFIFVVIIISILSSLFAGSRKGKENGGMPTFGGGSAGRPEPQRRTGRPSVPAGQAGRSEPQRTTSGFPGERPRGHQTVAPAVRPEHRPVQSEKRPVQSGYVEPKQPDRPAAAGVPAAQHPADPISDAASPIYLSRHPEELRKQVVQGMIWSEVFGQPIAKRRMMRR